MSQRGVVVIAANTFGRFMEPMGLHAQFELLTRSSLGASLQVLDAQCNDRPLPESYKNERNPMAGYYLETFLKLRGYDARAIFDWSNDDALLRALKTDPIAVCLSTTYITDNVLLASCLQHLRKVVGRLPIIVGGPYVWKQKLQSHSASELKQLGLGNRQGMHSIGDQSRQQALLSEFGIDVMADFLFSDDARQPLKDAIYIASEFGEHTLLRLLSTLESSRYAAADLLAVPNLVFTRDGSWVMTAEEPEPVDLDADFTRWDLVDEMPSTVVPLRTSVGCPYRCRYCDFIEIHPTVRMRSPASLMTEIGLARARGSNSFTFIDDNIFLSKARIGELTKTILENEMDITWGGFFRVDQVDETNIDALWASGCRSGLCGIESFDEKQLARMRKGCRTSEIVRGIDLCTEKGMWLHLTFIVGFPGETKETLDSTAATLQTLNTSTRGWSTGAFFPLYVIPNTAMDAVDYRRKYNLKGRFTNWSHDTMNYPDAVSVWTPYLFKQVKNIPMFHGPEYAPKGWTIDRRNRAFTARAEVTTAFLEAKPDDVIQDRFVELYQVFREDVPASEVPVWPTQLAERRFQAGAVKPLDRLGG